ncbi:hypothetical protein [Priestia flexa]|uniref:WD40/YVTN/BNR-like repeat-containing protein n=1 Tax=Priestia flexa TaxID=86664 RepID=UPI002892137E|nr:hypothetical protein [Priestia flexa]MDT2047678.1 hypothetical protein [Priestia flexa]
MNDYIYRWIQMRSSSEGWLAVQQKASKSLSLFYTSTGGQAWKEVTPTSAPILTAFAFTSTTAYAISEKRNSPSSLIVWGTMNRGRNWSSAVIVLPLKAQEHIQKVVIEFHNEAHGSLCIMTSEQKHLYKTFDRGLTWNKVSSFLINGMVTGLTFVNDQVGFLTVKGNKLYRSLYQTNDFGKTWSPAHFVSVAALLYPLTTDATAYKPLYVDGNIFVPFKVTGPVLHSLFYYYSNNFGKTWRMTPAVPYRGGAFSFPTSKSCLIANGSSGALYEQQSPLYVGKIYAQNEALKNMHCLHFVDRSTGFGCAKEKLYTTKDGGKTWSSLSFKLLFHQ